MENIITVKLKDALRTINEEYLKVSMQVQEKKVELHNLERRINIHKANLGININDSL